MKPRVFIPALLQFLLAACAVAQRPGAGAALPLPAQSDPAQYVVVTVLNDVRSADAGVASTPRGYSSVRPYVVSGRARALARGIAESYRLRETAAWPIAVLGEHCLVYRIEAHADRAALLADLQRDPRVQSAQALEMFNTRMDSAYNDTYAGLQRNLDQLAVAQAQRGSRGAGVRVAIIDTGVDVAHVDLKGRIAAAANFVDQDASQFRNDRHGTAVAGVVAAVANNRLGIAGIAPEVRLLAFKACWEPAPGDAAAVCNTFTLAQALVAAIDARVDIVNLSLGGPSDPLLTRLVRSGQRAGLIFVGAAPRHAASSGDSQQQPGFPLNVEGVIGVQASESGDLPGVLLAAPGEDIFTLAPGDHYDAASGSSLAAAEVTGVVALLRSRQPRLQAARAQELLARSSYRVASGGRGSLSVDACAAVAALTPGLSCAASERFARDLPPPAVEASGARLQ
jgi:subtilisin family serine protease